ncbi:MAG: hypothetical protein WHS46_09200 [Desulfosoma sp.]
MEERAPRRSNRELENKKFLLILLALLLVLTVGALYVLMKTGRPPFETTPPSTQKPAESDQSTASAGPDKIRRPIPVVVEERPPAPALSEPAASSYPEVSPETSQEERKDAFGLKTSVDHVVQPQEPFSAHGRQWTVEEIQKRLAGRATQTPNQPGPSPEPGTERQAVGGFLPKPLPTTPPRTVSEKTIYYGVRLVRPGENLWKIHYGVIREYFARRGIELPPRADQPRADGRSSGIGRLLKFLESIVHVYDARRNRLVDDINLLHPDDLIVFFNISELFEALDQVEAKDLEALRYLGSSLQIRRPSASRILLNRKDLQGFSVPPLPSELR